MTTNTQTEVAVIAGGCFWGVEDILRKVPGVIDTDVGYTGGWLENPTYHDTHDSKSGHAEAVKITYDPAQVSYGKLLEVYFTVAHDPTELNRQGPDVGTSYRSAIFPQSPGQEHFARSYINHLNASGIWHKPIATRIEHGGFFPAEAYHQNFAEKHPYFPYVMVNDRPKIAALRQKFPALYKG